MVLDILFVLPLLLCIFPMLYLLFFTLRAAAFVQSEHERIECPSGGAIDTASGLQEVARSGSAQRVVSLR